MFGINPAMVSFMVKEKLNEVIAGQTPDGFKRVSGDNPKKIVLVPTEEFQTEGVAVNSLNVSISYCDHEIIITKE